MVREYCLGCVWGVEYDACTFEFVLRFYSEHEVLALDGFLLALI
jgi:hypothetical protein